MTIINSKPLGSSDEAYNEALAACTDVREMQALRNKYLIERCNATVADNSGKLDLSNFVDPADSTGNGVVSRTVPILGRSVTFSGSTTLEVEKKIGEALTAAGTVQPRDSASGQFVAKEPDQFEQTQLLLRLRRGEIDVPTYLAASGQLSKEFDRLAVDRLGLDPEAVKLSRYQQEWAAASEIFLNSDLGSDWVGGEANKTLLGDKLIALGLTDAVDKVGALAQAYAQLKAEGALVENPELVKLQKAQFENATSFEEINAQARASLGMKPRQLWGR